MALVEISGYSGLSSIMMAAPFSFFGIQSLSVLMIGSFIIFPSTLYWWIILPSLFTISAIYSARPSESLVVGAFPEPYPSIVPEREKPTGGSTSLTT